MLVQMMRSNSRWLMIVISVLTIISFLWFFSNRTQVDRMVSDKAGSIYGRSLTTTELDRTRRELETASALGLNNLISPDVAPGRDFMTIEINHLILLHQAQAMGIFPTIDEITEAVKQLPVFQGAGGAFDSNKYAQFVSGELLSSRGFSENVIEDLVRRNLQFGKLREIVVAPVTLSAMQARASYEQVNTKTDVSVVRFPISDLLAGITPTDADIKKYYDDKSAERSLEQPEKRQVQYVRFGLDDAQAKLTGKERMDAMQPHADAASQYLEKLLDAKGADAFANLAGQEHLPVKTTAEFEENPPVDFPEAGIPRFAEAAFRLSERDPDSDVPLQTPDAFYVLHLLKVTPERPLTLEEARPRIIAALKEERARTQLAAKAEEARTKIADALKAGRPITEAAAAVGQKAEDIPGFSMMNPPNSLPDESEISAAAAELDRGELSKFQPTPTGGVLVYVRGRQGIDEKKFADEQARLMTGRSEAKRRLVFHEWLKASRDAANVKLKNGFTGDEEG